MRKIILMLGVAALTATSGVAFAQSVRSSNETATQIIGDTNIRAKGENIRTMATGKDSKAATNVGAVGRSTQIIGDTNIDATAKNVTTMATGKDSKATTNIGTVGAAGASHN